MFNTDKQGRYFLKDGKPYFFLIDTAWMSFSNPTLDEFEEFTKFRAEQGFNSLLIMNTPVFSDMSDNVRWFPFQINSDGSFDFENISDEYFNNAREKLKVMQKYGITPFIALVWGSYIKGSSLENSFECEGKQFATLDEFTKFVDYSIEVYKEFNPVWIVGGDVALKGDILEKYLYMAKRIRSKCKGDLIALHIADGSYVPEEFFKDNLIDFYTYQAGHIFDSEADAKKPVTMASKYYSFEPKLPIMNFEPMYEAHGFGNRFGRFDEFYLRRAFWYSVLSGANAGFVYGAHGTWMFFDKNSTFNNENWSKIPLNWRTAITLPGSYDTAYNQNIFMQYDMFRLEPCQSLNMTRYDEIIAAADQDKSLVVIYTPFTNYIILNLDLTKYDCKWYLLDSSKKVINAEIEITSGEELAEKFVRASKGQKRPTLLTQEAKEQKTLTYVEMYQHNCDGLLVCVKK